MKRPVNILFASGLVLAAAGLSSCGQKDGGDVTNIVEMNASDGSMNDMTVVESAVLDKAGAAAAADNEMTGGNSSNGM